MKVQIITSFGVPGCAPFAIGEELDVPKGVATVWIDAGRAVSLETEAEPVVVEALAGQTIVKMRETAVAKPRRKQTR